VAYTWSKTLDYSNEERTLVPTYLSPRWNYGPTDSDRRHRLVANWLWDLPRASQLWNHWFPRWVFDNWQFSGIASFITGGPRSVGFSTVDNEDITGGGDDVRIIVTGNPVLPRGDRSFDRFFNTSVFARPPSGSIGNASRVVYYGPGINNWELAFFKNIPIENKATFQFRWEMYNAFNHTQFAGVDSTARFDLNGQQINQNFGVVTSTRNPRVMQGALRILF